MSKLSLNPCENWVQSHAVALVDLLPDFVAMYSRQDFEALVIRMVHRADMAGLRYHDATLAFCYASIKLGIGFEHQAEHAWFDVALRAPESAWADNIWNGLRHALATHPGDGA